MWQLLVIVITANGNAATSSVLHFADRESCRVAITEIMKLLPTSAAHGSMTCVRASKEGVTP